MCFDERQKIFNLSDIINSPKVSFIFRYFLVLVLFFSSSVVYSQPDTVTVGYRDFNYGNTVINTPTGEKPESKLWFNKGSWWGILWDVSAGNYSIHRFDLLTNTWINTGTAVDSRSSSKSDALWDGQKLYVVSHVFTTIAGSASFDNSGRLYRYSYNIADSTYSLDSGFPVNVNSSDSEALVLEKDSSGQLWVTWVEGGNLMLNRSTTDDLTWGTPFALPTQIDSIDSDNISSIIAFGGNKIGVIWGNEIIGESYFAFHNDGDADTVWSAQETALEDAILGDMSDDHFNIKSISTGEVFAMVKTGLAGSNPSLYLIKRDTGGTWTRYLFSIFTDRLTRPILLIDEDADSLYVFAKSKKGGPEAIYKKVTTHSSPSFVTGLGDPFISSVSDTLINDVSSTKQNVSDSTGILTIASDRGSLHYFHNYIELSEDPIVSSFSPGFAAVGAEVTILGRSFTGATAVSFNGTAATSYTVIGDNKIVVTIPAGATTGPISVTNSSGSDNSNTDFQVSLPPFDLSTTVVGNGTIQLNPAGGSYGSPTDVTLTAVADPGYQFVKWEGALSGNNTEETLYMDRDRSVTATFVPVSDGLGPITLEETASGGSSGVDTVSTTTDLTAVVNDIYLAAISARANRAVTSVSGLGLTWTPVDVQCGGRDVIGVEVWMAQGTPTGDGAVTANFSIAPTNAVIAVTRYSGVYRIAPIDTIFSANTNGIDGACSGGTDSNLYNHFLTTLTPGSVIYGAAGLRNRIHSPGAGYTEQLEISQGTGGDQTGVAVMDRTIASPSVNNFNGTFNGTVDWAIIGIALRQGTTVFNLNTSTISGGAITLNPAGGVYDSADVVTVTAVPDSGHIFSGWSEDLSGSTNPESITMNTNKNVTATFTPQYTFSVDTVGQGGIAITPGVGILDSATAITLTATPDPGYSFIGWSGDTTASTNPLSFNLRSDTQITGTFVPLFDIATTVSGSGNIGLSPAGGTYDSSTVVTLTATPDAGFSFAGWSGDLTGNTNPDSVSVDSNLAIQATFIPQFTVTVTPPSNGSVSLNPPGGVYDSATVITVTATPDSGYDLASWSGDLSGDSLTKTLIVNSNKTVQANFDLIENILYTLSTASGNGGAITLSPAGGTYNGNTMVGVTAVPDSGYRFRDWDGDLNGNTNPDSVFMNTDRSVTASFIRQFVLDIDTVGNGIVTLSPNNAAYDTNMTVTMVATADPGWVFTGWSGDLVSASTTDSITMNADKNVTANFAALSAVMHESTLLDSTSVPGNSFTSDFTMTAVSGDLYLASISTRPFRPATSLTGMGLTWTLLSSQCSGRNTNGIEVWMAQGTPTGDDALTAVFASSYTTLVLSVSRYSGVHEFDPIGAMVAGNTNGIDGSCSGGTDSDNYSLAISTTDEDSYLFSAVALRNRVNFPGPGYIEHGEITVGSGADEIGIAVQDQLFETPTDTTINGTMNNPTDWAAIGLEIRPLQTTYSLTTNTIRSGSILRSPSGSAYDSATVVTLTAQPDSGYIFTGWSGDLSGTVNPDSLTMNSQKTVTATFLAQFTLDLTVNGFGTVDLSPAGGLYDSATVVTLTATPNPGYTFTGWTGDLTGLAIEDSVQMDSNITITASFAKRFDLTATSDAGGSLVLSPAGGIYDSSTVVTLTAVPDSGYGFTEWTGDLTGMTNPDSVQMDSNITVHAGFVLLSTQTYTVTLDTVGGGGITLTPPGGSYTGGDTVFVSATPDSGYRFGGWTGDLSGSDSPDTLFMNSNKSVTGNFIREFKLTSSQVGNGTVQFSPSTAQDVYDSAAVVTVTATPASGYVFSGWQEDLSGTDSSQALTMDSDKSVKAIFTSTDLVVLQQTITDTVASSNVLVTTQSITAVNDHLYLASISTRPFREATSISGLNLTWTRLASQCSGRDNTGVEIWMAIGTPDTDGPLTVNFSSTVTRAVVSVSRYSGVSTIDPIGATVAGNSNGVDGSCINGTDSSAYSIPITTTTYNSTIFGAIALRNRVHFPGTGYSEISESNTGSGADEIGLATQHMPLPLIADTTMNGTFNNPADWAAIAIEINPFNTTFDLTTNTISQGNILISPAGSTYDSATVVTLTAQPDSGYIFTGWTGDLSGTVNPDSLVMNDDKTVTANFLAQFTLDLTVTGPGSVDLSPAGGLYDSATVVTLTATPNPGYTFTGWTGDLSGLATEEMVQMDSNITVAASFAKRFDLTATSDAGGSLVLSPVGGTYDSSTVVTLTAVPDSGYGFTEWTGDLTGMTNPDSVQMDSNITVHAGFVLLSTQTYTVTLDTVGGGGITLTPPGGSYTGGDTVFVSATPDSGYRFGGWTGDLSGSDSPDTLFMNSNKSVTGNFIREFKLTSSQVGNGTVQFSPSTAQDVYDSAAVVTVTATPASGYVFSGWQEDLSGTDSSQALTMDSDKSVKAIFTSTDLVVLQQTITDTVASSNVLVTTQSITAVNDHLYLASISTRPFREATSISGLNLTWTRLASQCSGRDNTGVEIWMAIGTPDTDGPLTVNFSSTVTRAVVSVSRYSGVSTIDPIGATVAGNSNGVDGSCINGTDSSAYSIPITTTTYNSTIFGAIALRNRVHFPGTGYSEISESNTGSGADEIGLATQHMPLPLIADTTMNGTFNNPADWAAIAIEINPFNTTFDLTTNTISQGNILISPAGGTYDSATVVTLTAQPDSGYIFTGWTGDLSGAVNPDSLVMNADKTVTANFLAQFTLDLTVTGPGSVDLSPTGGLYDSATVVTLTATPNPGYTFTGWTGDLSGLATEEMVQMDSNITVAASFAKRFDLTATSDAGGSLVLSPAGSTYDSSTVVTLTATPDSGYAFTGWTGDLSGTVNPDSVQMDSNITVHAGFVLLSSQTYTVTLDTVGGGGITLTPPGGSYTGGDTVFVSATPDSGYRFGGWTGDLSGSDSPDTLFMNSNKSVTGTFIARYQLTVATTNGGSTNVTPDVGGIYDSASVATITATPDSGYIFTGWSGDNVSTDNPLNLTMDSDKAITPGFLKINPITLDEIISDSSLSTTQLITASLTGTANNLYLASVTSRPFTSINNVSGLGLTWTLISSQCSGRNNTGVEIWMAQGPSPSNGAVTVTFNGAPTTAVASVASYSGVHNSNPVANTVSANSNGIDGTCSGGTDGASYSIPFTTSGSQSTIYAAAALRNRSHNPGTDFVERNETSAGSGGNVIGLASQEKYVASAGADSVTGSFSGTVDWAVIAVELRPGDATYTLSTSVIGDGSITLSPAGGSYDSATVVTVTAVPVAGYVFSGWSGDLSGSTNPESVQMDSSISVTAQFISAFSLTVNSNNGSVALSPDMAAYDSATVVTMTATADSGYRFNGWTGDLVSSNNPDSVQMDSSITVNANFLRQFSLIANVNGPGSVAFDPDTTGGAIYDSATVVNLTATADSGYIFTGWTGDLTGNSPTDSVAMDSNITITANFAVQYQLTSSIVGNGSIAFSPDTTGGAMYDSATVVTLTAVPDSGFAFAGWSGDFTSNANPDSVQMDSSIQVQALFVSAYALMINSSNGNVALSPAGGVYDSATVVTMTATPDSAYRFLNWSGDYSSSDNPDSVQVDSSMTINANFLRQFSLASSVNGGGSIGFNPDTTGGSVYDSATTVILTATADSGYSFLNWSGGLSGSENPDTVLMNTDQQVTANFIRQFALDTTVIGNGSVTLNPPGGVYDSATTVILTATPDPDYVLFWSGDLTGSALQDTIIMDGDKSVTASFLEASPITFEEVQTGASTDVDTVETSVVLTAVNYHLYLAAVTMKSTEVVDTVEGLGLSWSRVDAQCSGRLHAGTELWMAIGMPSGNDKVKATFVDAPDEAVIGVARYSGVLVSDPIGNIVSGNDNGIDGACSGGSNSNSYSFNLTTTAESAFIVGITGSRNRTHTPGADYTEIVELSQGDGSVQATLAMQQKIAYLAGSHTVNGTFSGNVDWSMIAVEIKPDDGTGIPGLTVNTKVMLEGPFDAGSMTTTLNSAGFLPTQQQFNQSPWNYAGSDSVSSMPAGVVDWVLVSLRSTASGNDLAYRAGLLKSDGTVVDTNGTSALSFPTTSSGDYFIVIWHRNHLAIMSAAAITLTDSSTLYDFTTAQSQAYGTNPMTELSSGVFGMLAGDGNADGGIDVTDKNSIWRVQNATLWLYSKYSDFNLDSGIDVEDLNMFWRVNNGESTQVPNIVVSSPGGSGNNNGQNNRPTSAATGKSSSGKNNAKPASLPSTPSQQNGSSE